MTIKAKIYRGEVRKIYPTPEYPDPAKAALKDPEGVLSHWMSGSHPYAAGSGYGRWDTHPETGKMILAPYNPVSAGVHWSYSPQTIPERFTEGVFKTPQTGVPMPKRESNFITAQELVEHWHAGGRQAAEQAHFEAQDRGEIDWRQRFQTPEHIIKAEAFVERRENKDPAYRDLSADQIAKPYKMAVVWHGTHPGREHEDPDNPTTNYEDEINFRSGTRVPIHAARLSIPSSGVTTYEQKIWHPTPHIVKAGAFSGWHTSGFGHVQEKGLVPWSTVQFKDVEMPIEGSRINYRL
jgi:hypothetical protein